MDDLQNVFDNRARKCHDGNNISVNVEETDKNIRRIEHPQREIKRKLRHFERLQLNLGQF